MNRLRNRLATNLRKPHNDIFGWLAKQRMIKHNQFLEENAVRLCKIQPDYKILEIGCGPGIGLKSALKCVNGGSGKVYGIDLSSYMVSTCKKQFGDDIGMDKLEVEHGTLYNLPFNSNKFDRLFHCNVYYFISNLRLACEEMYRVLKPNSVMVTTLNLSRLKKIESSIAAAGGDSNPLKYMLHLEAVGFHDVKIEYLKDNGKKYEAIYAYTSDKSLTEDIF